MLRIEPRVSHILGRVWTTSLAIYCHLSWVKHPSDPKVGKHEPEGPADGSHGSYADLSVRRHGGPFTSASLLGRKHLWQSMWFEIMWKFYRNWSDLYPRSFCCCLLFIWVILELYWNTCQYFEPKYRLCLPTKGSPNSCVCAIAFNNITAEVRGSFSITTLLILHREFIIPLKIWF